MRVSVHIGLQFILFLASTVAGYFILKSVNPFEASAREFALFYLTFFLWIFSAASVFGFGARYAFEGAPLKYLIRPSLRQGMLLGILGVIALSLQGAAILTMWPALLLIAIFILIELYAVSR